MKNINKCSIVIIALLILLASAESVAEYFGPNVWGYVVGGAILATLIWAIYDKITNPSDYTNGPDH